MTTEANVIGVEILVSEIDAAISFFSGVLGFAVAFRGPAKQVPGETAVLDGGNIALTLLQPAEHGPRVLADRRPRVTQIVIGAPGESVLELSDRIRNAGVPVVVLDDGRVAVPPEVTEGILGFDVALLLDAVEL